MRTATNSHERTATMATPNPQDLAKQVAEMTATLEARHGAENAPWGGWRSQAVALVAERHLLNPYALDHMIRGAS